MRELPRLCVLDASVVVKMFVGECESQAVRETMLQRDADPESLSLVPDLVFVECANILWKKVRREGYPEDTARANLADLKLLALGSTPTRELIERALEIACAHRISAYDACYVALAEVAGAPLLTADARLAAALADAPCEVLTLGE